MGRHVAEPPPNITPPHSGTTKFMPVREQRDRYPVGMLAVLILVILGSGGIGLALMLS